MNDQAAGDFMRPSRLDLRALRRYLLRQWRVWILDQIDEAEAKRRAELARRRNATKPGKAGEAREKVQHIDPERLSKAIQ
jgi:hypothetical protein